MKLFRLLFRLSPGTAVFAVVAGLVGGIGTTASVSLLASQVGASAGEFPIRRFAFWCIIALLGASVSKRLLIQMANGSGYTLRMQLTRRILASPLRKLEAIGESRLNAVLSEDVAAVVAAAPGVPLICTDATVLLACLVYLGRLSLLGLAMFLALLATAAGVLATASALAGNSLRRARADQDSLYEHFRGLSGGGKELRLHRPRREAFTRSLRTAARDLRDHASRGMSLYYIAAAVCELLILAGIGVFLGFGTRLVGIPHATIAAFALTVIFMMGPVQVILSWTSTISKGVVALEKLDGIGLDAFDSEVEPETPKPSPVWSSLRLLGVTHSYHHEEGNQTFTLGPVDLRFEPGKLTYLVGGNGSGKSTLAKLILGLYSPDEGEIRLDNEPVTDATRDRYRQHFSAIFADFHLFDDLRPLDLPDLDARAQKYLALLRLDQKVRVRDGRFSTTSLSTGQRKRLALVTAYLEDRPFYVFDEWASDQDPVFKRVFYTQLLPDLKARGKAVLVITHDDKYFHLADEIIKLDAGQIVEEGTANFMQRISAS